MTTTVHLVIVGADSAFGWAQALARFFFSGELNTPTADLLSSSARELTDSACRKEASARHPRAALLGVTVYILIGLLWCYL